MLAFLHGSRGGPNRGFVSGTMLRDLFGTRSESRERCESDDHQVQLLRDLVEKGMAEEVDGRTMRDERFSLDILDYRITGKGTSLIERSIGPDPDIDDDRIVR